MSTQATTPDVTAAAVPTPVFVRKSTPAAALRECHLLIDWDDQPASIWSWIADPATFMENLKRACAAFAAAHPDSFDPAYPEEADWRAFNGSDLFALDLSAYGLYPTPASTTIHFDVLAEDVVADEEDE